MSYISVESAITALDNMDDYARMEIGVDAHGPRKVLEQFIQQYKLLAEANSKLMGENANLLGQKLMFQNKFETIKEHGKDYLDSIIESNNNRYYELEEDGASSETGMTAEEAFNIKYNNMIKLLEEGKIIDEN